MRMTASRVYTRPQPVPKMPPGMVELIEGLTRDVLKNNPPNVYEFCANHMEKLLEIRDGPVSKRPMNLEEKITRAQLKVRDRAEQRKRQYDNEMKLRTVKRNGELKAENNEEIVTQPKLEEIEAQIISEPIVESILKAPVHHEQELTDALEVEIYHKPNDSKSKEEFEDFKMSEVKETELINETAVDELEPNAGKNDEIEVSIEKPEKKSNDSTVLETDGILEKSKTSSIDENAIVNDKQQPQEYIRKPSVENFVENAELTSNGIKEVHDVEQMEFLINQSQSVTSEQETEKKEGVVELPHKTIDHKQTVVKESLNKSEEINQNQSDQLQLENVTDLSVIESQKSDDQNTDTDAVSRPVIKPSEIDQEQTEVKNPESNDSEVVDDAKKVLVTENMDILPEGLVSTLGHTTEDEKLKEESDVGENTAHERKSEDKDEPQVFVNVKEELCARSSTKADCNAENLEPSIIAQVKAEVQSKTSMDANIVCQHNEIDTDNFPQPKDVDGVDEEKEFQELLADKNPEDTSDTVHTNNSNSTIYEDRVLVVELADVKDDNASVPEQNVESDISPSEVKVLGTNLMVTPVDAINEDTDKDSLSEGDSEKPDTDQLTNDIEHSILERSKRHLENISEGIENVSSITDVGKSDNETTSLGKSSSMDDSAPEDGNDSIGSEIRTNGKSIHSTNSNAMDLETAAVTIQKVFRTFLFKSRASTFEDSVNDDNVLTDEDSEKVDIDLLIPPPTNIKERRGLARMDTVLQTVNEEKSLSLSTDDSSLSSAATVIQAHVRGFLVRNKLNFNKTTSSASLVNSDGPSTSLEADVDQNKPNKTVLNIIVPEGGHFLSRDESVLTSMDLSLDGSPPSSVNLHPLGYDKSEPRKQLKRGDAIQSISPPSNNSGKLSEEVDSVKEILNDSAEQQKMVESSVDDLRADADTNSRDTTPTKSTTVETVVEAIKLTKGISGPDDDITKDDVRRETLRKMSSDESDVITPFEEKTLTDSDNTLGLLHSGEFHDVVLPTKISRSDTSVVREFKNVVAYFLIWNNS